MVAGAMHAPAIRACEVVYVSVSRSRGAVDRRPEILVDQYDSDEITSPLARVPSAHQVGIAIEFLMNFTLPSPNPTLTPPEWKLEALT